MIKWKGRTWETQESWGVVHPDYPYQYTDSACVEVDAGKLILKTRKKEKKYIEEGFLVIKTLPAQERIPIRQEISIPWARGLVMCMDKFHFGRYTIIATLPKGKNLWPAIWLYGHDHWPPEIDIMEGYSNSFGSYFNLSCNSFKSFWHSIKHPYKIEANYHIDAEGGLGTERAKLGYFQDMNKAIRFEMFWSSDKIILTVNDHIYSKLQGDVMKHFQKPMRFLMNNGIRRRGEENASESEFVIHHFYYNPYY